MAGELHADARIHATAVKELPTVQDSLSARSGTDQARRNLLWQAAIEEYKSLRSEVIVILDRQYSMLYWAISSVAVMLAAIISGWDRLLTYPNLLVSVFFLLIPIVAMAFILGWSHLIVKLSRLGAYLHGLETKLSRIVESPGVASRDVLEAGMKLPIGWEHTLWQQEGQEFINRACGTIKWGTAVLYLLILTSGSVLFLWRLRASFEWLSKPHAVEAVVGVFVCWITVWLGAFRHIRRQLVKAVELRNDYDRVFDKEIG